MHIIAKETREEERERQWDYLSYRLCGRKYRNLELLKHDVSHRLPPPLKA